jgi:hypothetical protein
MGAIGPTCPLTNIPLIPLSPGGHDQGAGHLVAAPLATLAMHHCDG